MNGTLYLPVGKQATSSARSTALGEERYYVKYHRPRNWPRALRGKRQYDKSHRPKKRNDCATRTSVTGGWPERNYDPRLRNSWGIHRRFGKSAASTAQTPTIKSAAKESASEEKTLIEGRSVVRAAFPGNPREPGLLEDGSLQRTTGQATRVTLRFSSD